MEDRRIGAGRLRKRERRGSREDGRGREGSVYIIIIIPTRAQDQAQTRDQQDDPKPVKTAAGLYVGGTYIQYFLGSYLEPS